MKKLQTLFSALLIVAVAGAQTLNVTAGSVTYQFPAAQTGDMEYHDGTTLTVMGKTFTLSDISGMSVDDSEVTDNLVKIVYSGTSAKVTVAGNVAQYVTATVNGAYVSIDQSNTDAVDGDEITYQLSGSSSDGQFALSGSYKTTVSLAGVDLTCATGAAISIDNKKRIQVSVKNGTENTLTDGANGSQKGCLYSKGQIQLQGKGTLTVVGKTKHAVKSGDYIQVKNLTLNVTSAVGDGISCNKYFLMQSGTVTVSGVADDGIQCDLEEDDDKTAETTDHEDENSGNIYLAGGTLNVTATGAATKGVKAAGDIVVSGGTINVTTTGNGAYDSDEQDAKGCAGLKADNNITINGGTLTLKSTGTGGKCIKADNLLTINDGVVTAKSSYHEAIESKATIDISGGYVYAESSDDAINSASNFTITGGYVMGNSSGNDGLDANGNCYIKGGHVFAVASRQPEVGIDANTEGGYKLYVTGGYVAAIGGLESGSSLSGVTSKSVSYSKGQWYTLNSSGSAAFTFKVPSNSSMGTSMTICAPGTPTVTTVSAPTGTTIWNGYGVK